MEPGRVFRSLLLFFLPVSLGLVGRQAHAPADAAPAVVAAPVISPPTQSLPTPVHDEATCAFCQAAIFSPCPPTAAPVPDATLGTVHDPVVSPDARMPHVSMRRLAESRAPPALRIV
jgi:hypothetical protein